MSKNIQAANKDILWTQYEMPPIDAIRLPGKSGDTDFISLQHAKKSEAEFIPLGGKHNNKIASYNHSEPTIEEKRVLLEKEAYEKGFAQGEKDGLELGETKTKKVFENIDNLLDEMTHLKAKLVKQHEKDILEMIFSIAKKIIHTHMQFDETAVRDTILAAFNLTAEKRDITLKINPEDFDYVEKLRPDLFARHMNVKSIMITSDPTIIRGGCLLETANGDVDATIETQLDIIYQSLKDAYIS